jgi:hypothetical protein
LSIHSVAEGVHADTVIYFEVDDVDSAVQRRVA